MISGGKGSTRNRFISSFYALRDIELNHPKWTIPLFFLSLVTMLAAIQACTNNNNPTFAPQPARSQPQPSCVNYGNNAAVSAITPVALPVNAWVAYSNSFAYTGSADWAQSFNSFSVFAANSSGSSAATLELAVYNQGGVQQLLADTTLTVPANASQWFTVALSGSVTDAGTVYLVAHALTGNLSIGTMPVTDSSYQAGGSCNGASGSYQGAPLPASLPLAEGTAPCYAMYIPWCSLELVNPCNANPCYDPSCPNYDPTVCNPDPCDTDPCYDTSCYNYDPSVCDTDPCDSDPCSDPSCPGYDPDVCG
jgi:hypothetical protein